MCWFGARWNVQRDVKCIVNCTIPWTNWHVNTHCDVWALPAHACFSVDHIQFWTYGVLSTTCINCILLQCVAHTVYAHVDSCDLHLRGYGQSWTCSCMQSLHCTQCILFNMWLLLWKYDTCNTQQIRAASVHEAVLAHPPNLSILVSGGECTTLYAFSHCEWTRDMS